MQTVKMIYKRCSALLRPILALICVTAICLSAISALSLATKFVSIKDGSNTIDVHTLSSEPEIILQQAGVKLSKDDKFTFSGFEKGSASLTVLRAFNVTVSTPKQSKVLTVNGGTVADAIKQSGLVLNPHDIVSHKLTQSLTDNMHIEVTEVDVLVSEKLVEIPFDTKVTYSGSLYEGKTETTPGQNGYKMVTYQQKVVNGVITETTVIGENVVKPAVSATKVVGTKKPSSNLGLTYLSSTRKYISTLKPSTDFALDDKGVPKNYKKVIKGNASAYSGGGWTATGKGVRLGYVAVNPKQIPYGTKLFIRSTDGNYYYGYASAEDTGGFIYWGTRVIDLYFSTEAECVRFGVRGVEIYVL